MGVTMCSIWCTYSIVEMNNFKAVSICMSKDLIYPIKPVLWGVFSQMED